MAQRGKSAPNEAAWAATLGIIVGSKELHAIEELDEGLRARLAEEFVFGDRIRVWPH